MNKFLIRLTSCFLLKKKKRVAYREQKFKELYQEQRKKSRWGVSYSVFDGEELLKPSLLNIRKHVDYINVVYQRNSWYGNPANPNLKEMLMALKDEGLVDELIEYVPDYTKTPGHQEREKRNLGLAAARKNGVHYFMTMDVDEFYFEKEFEKAKDIIIERDITQSFVPICDYGYSPRKRRIDTMVTYVPFFAKLRKNNKLGKNPHTPCFVDKTRKFGHSWNDKYYIPEGVAMHHMSFVRRSLMSKFVNSSTLRDDMDGITFDDVFKGQYVDVEDYFGIEPFLDYEKSAL